MEKLYISFFKSHQFIVFKCHIHLNSHIEMSTE